MSWLDTAPWQAAVTCLAVCAALGAAALPLVARLPEPEPQPVSGPVRELAAPRAAPVEDRKLFARTLPPAPPKQLYADIASSPGLRLRVAVASGAIGAAFGGASGWAGALLYLIPLVPISVVLMVIDWRTTLLPTRILHPTYLLLAVLIPLAALVDSDLGSLYRAAWGWLIVGGWFWVIWWLFNAWGFGDVRLARVLGPALGYLGWSQLLIGLALILFVGAIGGLAMAAWRGSLRARVPYGPSMLVGAALAVVAGPWLAQRLGY